MFDKALFCVEIWMENIFFKTKLIPCVTIFSIQFGLNSAYSALSRAVGSETQWANSPAKPNFGVDASCPKLTCHHNPKQNRGKKRTRRNTERQPPAGSAEYFSKKSSKKGRGKKKKSSSPSPQLASTRTKSASESGDGVERVGEAAASDRGVVRGARRRRQAAAHGCRGLLARLLQRLRPLRLPRHRLQVRRDGLRRQGTPPSPPRQAPAPLLPPSCVCCSVLYHCH